MSTVTRHRPETNGPARPTNAGGSCPTPIGVAETATLTQLKAAAAEGDPQSWAELVRRFTSLLWSIARSHRLNEADAADVVQNTWLRLLENLGRIDQPEALPGWLATTARREALNVLRRHTRGTPVDEQYFHTVDADAPELDLHLLIHERDTHLWTCFQQLPQRDQQLLRACIASDRPCYTAIAKDLNMPIGSIGPTRMRALKRLRILLEASTYTFHATTTQSTFAALTPAHVVVAAPPDKARPCATAARKAQTSTPRPPSHTPFSVQLLEVSTTRSSEREVQ